MGVRQVVLAALATTVATAAAAAGGWTHAEKIETYAIAGQSGIELYRSIGDRGPQAGVGQAIAYTTYKLLWSRNYVPQPDGACRLESAKPNLTIIYKLPKPSGKLPAETQRLWDEFIAGIEKHERVHGDYTLEAVRQIEAATVGLTVADDRACKKIRGEVTALVAAAAEGMRARNRAFDKLEMSKGGNVHQLILALVNGDR